MSSPGFLLANDSNHDLLQSLLESMNAIIEHQYMSKRYTLFDLRFVLFPLAKALGVIIYIVYLSEELGLSHDPSIEINMTRQGFQSRSKLAL